MKSFSGIAVTTACVLFAHTASAEVTLGESKGWEAFTTGNVSAFLTYATGDGFPVATAPKTIIPGGGISTNKDAIPKKDAAGMAIATDPGTLAKWRVRSGVLPNIVGVGVRSIMSPELKLTGFVAIWGTIESKESRKYFPVTADFHEAYLNAAGSWGSVTAGRTLSLFSRGMTQMDMMYGHRYGVGVHGSVGDLGPTAGMVGFGVLSASYNPGIYYTTPDLGGLRVNLGMFDAIRYQSSWTRTQTPRPEGELTYDFGQDTLKLHVFVNGAFQKLYIENNAKDDETLYGVSGGLRFEAGPFHVGAGGHYGRGVGLWHAFDDSAANLGNAGSGAPTIVGPAGNDPVTMMPLAKPNELRTFDGFSAMLQYAPGKFDINLGFGQSRAHQLKVDELLPASLIKTQTGVSAGFVWHFSENLHGNLDFMRAMFSWYKGDKQDVNFINAGATLDW